MVYGISRTLNYLAQKLIISIRLVLAWPALSFGQRQSQMMKL